MKKIHIITVALTFCTLTVSAQKGIKDILCGIPETVIPYINDEQREEISKFTSDADTVKIKNKLNGITEINVAGNDFAQIKLNKSATLQLKLLPLNDTTQVICLIKTMATPIKESAIKFYSTDWKPLAQNFGLPEFNDADIVITEFTQRPDTMQANKFEELCEYLEPVIIYADISPKDNIITYEPSIPFASKAEKEELRAIIKQKSYKWTGYNFKKY